MQLNEGLSSEYIKNRKTEDGDVDESTAKFDADRQVNSKYFVNQILQQGEEGLRDAWSKVGILQSDHTSTASGILHKFLATVSVNNRGGLLPLQVAVAASFLLAVRC